MFSSEYRDAWAVAHEPATVSFDPATCPPLDPRWISLLRSPDLGGERVHDVARQRKYHRFGGRVFPVVPVYVTSVCGEHCLYCNYRAGNKGIGVERLRLSDAELAREVEFLIDAKGFRCIELVYASDPKMGPDVIARHIDIVHNLLERRGGGVVGLSAQSFEARDYRTLHEAGLTFSIIWQETYDRVRYAELHPFPTQKSDFEYRLDSYERMLEGGIRHIGMGVLSGLADWRGDWSMLLQHELYLSKQCGAPPSIIGLPRLKPAAGAFAQDEHFRPDDRQFASVLAIQNAFLPHSRPFVSTRETFEFGLQLAAGGGCLFTLNCSTIPGGYTLGHGGGQFTTGCYDAAEYTAKLQDAGFEPVFDWSFDTLKEDAAVAART